MFHAVYVIWALLPLVFLVLAGWAFSKRFFGVSGREYPSSYLSQFFFCLVAFVVSIYLDQYVLEDAVEALTAGMLDIIIARWLLFPGILVGMAWVQKLVTKKPEQLASKYTPARYGR